MQLGNIRPVIGPIHRLLLTSISYTMMAVHSILTTHTACHVLRKNRRLEYTVRILSQVLDDMRQLLMRSLSRYLKQKPKEITLTDLSVHGRIVGLLHGSCNGHQEEYSTVQRHILVHLARDSAGELCSTCSMHNSVMRLQACD